MEIMPELVRHKEGRGSMALPPVRPRIAQARDSRHRKRCACSGRAAAPHSGRLADHGMTERAMNRLLMRYL
jgi:hypothetical protein